MTSRDEAYLDLADVHAFAVFQRLLLRVGHVLEAHTHDGECLGRGERLAVAGPGMVAMTMGDHRPRYGNGRIDVKISGRAIKTARRRVEPRSGVRGAEV